MKPGSSVRVLMSIGIWMALSASLYAAGYAARASLPDATTEAKKWQADAILTSVSSLTVGLDGKATSWFYGFYSARARKFLNVTAKGRAIETLELPTGQTAAVNADFLDSDKVMEAAVTAGLKGDSPRMQLTRTAWLVSGGSNKGDVIIFLNPLSAKLIRRQTVQ
jgi:hypothetical protein